MDCKVVCCSLFRNRNCKRNKHSLRSFSRIYWIRMPVVFLTKWLETLSMAHWRI